MGSLDFPCQKCGKKFAYKELVAHECGETHFAQKHESKKRKVSVSISDMLTKNSPVRVKREVEAEPEHEHGDEGNFVPESDRYYDKLDHLLDEREREKKRLRFESALPLAEVLRPKKLSEYAGHNDLVGHDGLIMKYIYMGNLPSIIFWGEPGIGKTSLVRLILGEIKESERSHELYQISELSAASSTMSDVRKLYQKYLSSRVGRPELRMVLFLDEIHRFNKLQQDFFLSLIENNELILLACTTENPSYKINNAILSRCQVFELPKPTWRDLLETINRGCLYLNRVRIILDEKKPLLVTKEAKEFLAKVCDGDYRMALNTLESVSKQDSQFREDRFVVDRPKLRSFLEKTIIGGKSTTLFHDLFSAMRYSILGNDCNAAIIYLGYLIQRKADFLDIANFLHEIVMNECSGDPELLEMSQATHYTVTKLGYPEADAALAHLVYLLADFAKSDKLAKIHERLETFMEENPSAMSLKIPFHIRNAPTDLMQEWGYSEGYKYNPEFKDGKVRQYYLPRGIRKMDFVNGADADNESEAKDKDKLLDQLFK